MKTLFSTTGIHTRDRFPLWYEVACKSILPHESRPKERSTFSAAIQHEDVAGLGVFVLENSPMTVHRTPASISRGSDDWILVCRQLAGKAAFEQQAQQVHLTQGDITLLDAQRVYHCDFPSASRLLMLKVPRHALQARCGDLSALFARRAQLRSGVGTVMLTQLAVLERGTGVEDAAVQTSVREYTLDLIALSLAMDLGVNKSLLSTSRSLALSNLLASIEMRLSDPDLNAYSAAQGAGISVRYANALLQGKETSIVQRINERRLQRCKEVLSDPLQNGRTISEVAYSWGFSDLSYFGRLFKRRFGLSPREYRQRAREAKRLANR